MLKISGLYSLGKTDGERKEVVMKQVLSLFLYLRSALLQPTYMPLSHYHELVGRDL